MTDLADREWRLIAEASHEGPKNMALDEIAAETAASGGPRTLRVYRWEPSTLSLGYRQEPDTVDWDFCKREGISVTRRPTGGGGIYHDNFGDISYSIVAPAEELPGDLMDCYELLCEPVLDAFSRMGVEADFTDEERPSIYQPACYLREMHPAHDIAAGGSAADAASSERAGGHARKISGNAQYRRKDAVIQHGSLMYDLPAERHLGTFVEPTADARTFRERVTTIREQSGIDREAAVSALEDALGEWADAEVGDWTEAELVAAEERAAGKFQSSAWNRERTNPPG